MNNSKSIEFVLFMAANYKNNHILISYPQTTKKHNHILLRILQHLYLECRLLYNVYCILKINPAMRKILSSVEVREAKSLQIGLAQRKMQAPIIKHFT